MAEYFYIVPTEIVHEYDKQPKYLDLMDLDGAPRTIKGQVGSLVDFYVVLLRSDAAPPAGFLIQNDIIDIEQSSVVKVPTKSKLAGVGVDLTGITNQSTAEDIERRIYLWLIGEDKTTAEVFAGR